MNHNIAERVLARISQTDFSILGSLPLPLTAGNSIPPSPERHDWAIGPGWCSVHATLRKLRMSADEEEMIHLQPSSPPIRDTVECTSCNRMNSPRMCNSLLILRIGART
ncbi:hypothetical protein C8Q74DRAFT_1261893 [Fomes fomentarius]|nr:hypothetical protein C8Q74DRAFT_1261893 [Fomes fomentarius]